MRYIPDWETFAQKYKGRESEAFQALARTLFCKEHDIKPGQLRQRVNQRGNEAEVIEKKGGKIIGFQAKYFDKRINVGNIISSMRSAMSANPQQNHYYIYCNLAFGNPRRGQKKTKAEIRIQKEAKKLGKLNIEWRQNDQMFDILQEEDAKNVYDIFFNIEFLPNLIDFNECIKNGETLPGGAINSRKLSDDKSFWKDEVSITEVKEGLKKNPYYVIKGAEGRGKSILSYQVALDLIETENYWVFVTKRSWEWQEIYKELDALLKIAWPVLVVLENIHQDEENFSNILYYANDHKQDNHLFLMNMRPQSGNKIDPENFYLDSECFINLNDSQEERALKILEHLAGQGQSKLNIETLTIEGESLQDNLPPNVRVLSRIIQTIREKKDTNVNHKDVLSGFGETYGLQDATRTDRTSFLLKLGALNIFDVPLDKVGLTESERRELAGLLRNSKFKGLYYEQGDKLFLSHSTDAIFLCKFICMSKSRGDEDLDAVYKNLVEDAVKQYYENLIIEASKWRDEVRDEIDYNFLAFMSSLVGMKEFRGLLEHFREPETAKKVIKNICPRFVLGALVDNTPSPERLEIYTESIPVMKDNFSRYSFASLSRLSLVLRHYDVGIDLVEDIFADADIEELTNWLLRHDRICRDRFLRRMREIEVFSRALNEAQHSHPGIVRRKTTRYTSILTNIKGELSVIAQKLEKENIENVQGRIETLITKIKDEISSSFDENLAEPLSYIFRTLESIDSRTAASCRKFSPELMKSEAVLTYAEERLLDFGFEKEEFYYFSHFYNNDYPEIRDKIKDMISKVTDQELMEKMIYWVCLIRKAYKFRKLNLRPFKENTLAYDVEKIVLADAQARLSRFSYNEMDFQYFSYFYSDAYPDIKNRVDGLISNVEDNWKRNNMTKWIEKRSLEQSQEWLPMALTHAVKAKLR